MRGKKNNNLIVIENGQLTSYLLDDKLLWEIGRPSSSSSPDIKFYSPTVSRKHGRFENMDGFWYYLDNNGKNGTVHNGKHISAGRNGRVKPVMLSDGDVLIFGGGEEAVINHKTIWTLFSTRYYDERWKVVDTSEYACIELKYGNENVKLEKPEKGTVIEMQDGIAIYMGDLTYMVGDISLIGN